jgi:hypothetical protein
MPERWQRELRKLRDVEPRDPIGERAVRAPSDERPPSRRDPLIAGVVAGAVAIAGVAFLWQLSPDEGTRETGGGGDLPTLNVTFATNGTIGDTPSDAAPIRRVDTTITYGDALEEDFTSTTPIGAHVDYVSVEQVTRFVPGPTAGSAVRIEADGENPRVLIGRPTDWPEIERFTPIEVLPNEPGEYVLLFEADYAEGTARTARSVRIVAPGGLQLVATGGHALDAAAAVAFVDGRQSNGFLSASWYTEGDFGVQTEPRPPRFADDDWLALSPGPAVALASNVTEARAGVLETYSDGDSTSTLPLDLLQGPQILGRRDGRYLLALDVTWIEVAPGTGNDKTEERAFFYFPIEIGSAPQPSELPTDSSPIPSPLSARSPSPAPVTDGILVSVFGVGERSDEMPVATFSYGGETKTACTQDFEWTREDGTELSGVADPGRTDSIPECSGRPIEVPPGASIALETTSTTRVTTTRATTPFFEGEVGLVVEAVWPDGHATFIVPLTVAPDVPALELVVLDCRPEDQVAFSGPENRIEPAGSAYIIGNLPGFEQGDVVEQMTREDGSDAGDLAGVWQVVREGSVVASVDYPDLTGLACPGTGIGGA